MNTTKQQLIASEFNTLKVLVSRRVAVSNINFAGILDIQKYDDFDPVEVYLREIKESERLIRLQYDKIKEVMQMPES